MTYREKSIRKILTDGGLDEKTREGLKAALRSIYNAEFFITQKEICKEVCCENSI